jgi:transcriptional regulator with XRE-family HTH domain
MSDMAIHCARMGDNLRKLLAARVRALRTELDLSIDRLAELAGVHRNSIYGLEKSQTWPTPESLSAIAFVLRTTPVDLFREADAGRIRPTPLQALAVVADIVRDYAAPRKAGEDGLPSGPTLPPGFPSDIADALSSASEDQLHTIRLVLGSMIEPKRKPKRG